MLFPECEWTIFITIYVNAYEVEDGHFSILFSPRRYIWAMRLCLMFISCKTTYNVSDYDENEDENKKFRDRRRRRDSDTVDLGEELVIGVIMGIHLENLSAIELLFVKVWKSILLAKLAVQSPLRGSDLDLSLGHASRSYNYIFLFQEEDIQAKIALFWRNLT